MQPARLTPVSALAAACAGAAAWCSLGTLALSDAGARAVRVGLLAPLWWLGVCVASAIALSWGLRLPSDRAKPLFFSVVFFLPWLPLRLPAAALLWAGPLACLVWVGIATAVLVAGDTRLIRLARVRSILTDPARGPWVAFVCAAMVYTGASWRLAPLGPGGDEPHYLVIAQSLWRDGDLRIENNHRRGDYREYFGGELRPDFLKRGIDEQIYSIHLPGLPAIIAPVLAVGGYSVVKLFLAFASAAGTAVAWRAAYLVTGRAAAAWFGWAAVALAAPVVLLSFAVYPDGPGAVLVLVAFALIAALPGRASRPTWWWAGAGLLPALLPWFHPRFSVLAAALGLVFAGRALCGSMPARALAAFIVLPAASAVGWFGYYYAIYGSFHPSVAYGYHTQMSLGRVPTGILGLLFDQQYGLIVYAPVFAIGVAGLAALAQSHRRLALEWSAVVLPYAVVTAMYHMWWGGFSSPARFIGATLLLFAVPLAAAWAATTHAATRAVEAVALAVSVGITAMLLAVERGEFVLNVRDTASPWLTWASQMADLTRAVPSLFRHGPLIAAAEAAVWTASLLGAWVVARAVSRAWGVKPGASALVSLCAIGAAVTVGAAATWRIEGASGTRVTFGQLRTLEAAGTYRGARGVVLESREMMPAGLALDRLRVGAGPVGGNPSDDWLSLPFLPAGRYRLHADLSPAAALEATFVAGRSDRALDSWTFAAGSGGVQSRDFALPVGVADVRVGGDAGARGAVRGVWIQPAFAGHRPRPVTARRAASARRYGALTVYAVASAYLEPDGLWTAGGRTAELVVQPAPGERLAMFTMRTGPVATLVELRAGAFSLKAELAPGEARELAIPVSADGSVLVTIRTGRGFRPSDGDGSNADRRLLGVRLEHKR